MSQEVPFRFVAEITRPMLRKYADASGDHNEIHLDDEVARKRGLPGVIAHGMLIAGMLAERGLRHFMESTGTRGHVKLYNARFRAMVFPGDRISIGGIVRSAGPEEWVLDLAARNQKDEVTTSALVTIAFLPN